MTLSALLRICPVLFFIFTSVSTFASEKIVLLTAIDEPSEVLEKLDKMFLRSYEQSGLEPVIVHRADQLILRQYLTAPDIAGLFWISHAGAEQKFARGVAAQGTILDIHKNNVKNLF